MKSESCSRQVSGLFMRRYLISLLNIFRNSQQSYLSNIMVIKELYKASIGEVMVGGKVL